MNPPSIADTFAILCGVWALFAFALIGAEKLVEWFTDDSEDA